MSADKSEPAAMGTTLRNPQPCVCGAVLLSNVGQNCTACGSWVCGGCLGVHPDEIQSCPDYPAPTIGKPAR